MLADYQLFYDQKTGQLVSINSPEGKQLVFYPETKTFDDNNPEVIKLRSLEAELGETLDISDHPGTIPDYSGLNKTEELISRWRGYYLNNCTPSANYLSNSVFDNPRNINWDKDLATPLIHEPVVYKFLRIGKLYFLESDPEAEADEEGNLPLLPERLLINIEHYDYGNFNGLLPEKRSVRINSVYREDSKSDRVVKQYMTLPNELITKNKIYQVAVGRRIDAINYIKTRALEIDRLMPGVYNLENRVQDYFRDNLNEMTLFEKTGATDILSAIADKMTTEPLHWFNVPIPVALDQLGDPILRITGNEIKRILEEAIAPITSAEVSKFWELFATNDFTQPTVAEVESALSS